VLRSSAVEGARAATFLFQRKRSDESDAPSTILRANALQMVPLTPLSRGRMQTNIHSLAMRLSVLPSPHSRQRMAGRGRGWGVL
jgi:hypothetical protein